MSKFDLVSFIIVHSFTPICQRHNYVCFMSLHRTFRLFLFVKFILYRDLCLLLVGLPLWCLFRVAPDTFQGNQVLRFFTPLLMLLFYPFCWTFLLRPIVQLVGYGRLRPRIRGFTRLSFCVPGIISSIRILNRTWSWAQPLLFVLTNSIAPLIICLSNCPVILERWACILSFFFRLIPASPFRTPATSTLIMSLIYSGILSLLIGALTTSMTFLLALETCFRSSFLLHLLSWLWTVSTYMAIFIAVKTGSTLLLWFVWAFTALMALLIAFKTGAIASHFRIFRTIFALVTIFFASKATSLVWLVSWFWAFTT